MKTITDKIPCIYPLALVLTANTIGIDSSIFAADFRDNRSLWSNKLNSYLGFRPDIRVITIKPKFQLINGIWYSEVTPNETSLPMLELDLIVKEWEWTE